MTLYAQWNPHAYYVHFDPNGADTVDTSVALDQKFFHGISQELLPCEFNLEGFHFLGWNTEADGSGADYQSGVALEEDLAAAGGQVTLYAQWNEEPESGQINPDDDPNGNPNGNASQDQDELAASHAQEKLAQTGDSATGVFSALAALAVAACVAAAGAWRRARR